MNCNDRRLSNEAFHNKMEFVFLMTCLSLCFDALYKYSVCTCVCVRVHSNKALIYDDVFIPTGLSLSVIFFLYYYPEVEKQLLRKNISAFIFFTCPNNIPRYWNMR